MLQRLLFAGAAIAAAVWLSFGLHSALLQRAAQHSGFRDPQSLTRSEIAHAVDLFQRARGYNPDTQPAVNEAALLARVGQERRAVALLKGVVDKEPDNVTAWVLLAQAAGGSDPPLAARAVSRARKLNPPVAPLR